MEGKKIDAIDILGSTDFGSIDFASTVETVVMCTLKAPTIEDDVRSSRAPIDLVAVIDVSGSMSGQKLSLVQTSMEFMVQQLKDSDRLSLVSFQSSVNTVLDLVEMNAAGKKQALQAIQNLRAGGGTNLSGGLLAGLDVLRNRSGVKHDVSTVLLFTDGQPSTGLKTPAEFVKAEKGMIALIDTSCSVFTFGFGSDHDSQLLQPLAEEANGMFYYIKSQEEIAGSFGDCLGGLLSVFGQNIKLQCESLNGRIVKVLSDYPTKVIEDGKKQEISIGDIYSDEEKNILISVSLPAIQQEQEKYPVMQFTISYFDVIATKPRDATTSVTINRETKTPADTEKPAFKPVFKVAKQMNRVMATSALKDAMKAADSSDFSTAQKILSECKQKIQKSVAWDDAMVQDLVKDIDESTESMNKSSYDRGGKSAAMASKSKCSKERSNKPGMYQNAMKSKMAFDSTAWAQQQQKK